MAVTGEAFAITFGYYCAACVLLFGVFGFLRNHKLWKKFYSAKVYLPDEIIAGGFVRPPPLPKAYLSWIAPVLSYDQRQVLAYAGLDGLTMMRVLYFGLLWSLVASFVCLAAILPVNLVGGEVDNLIATNTDPDVTYSTIDKFTMANIKPKNALVVVHVVVVYFLTLFTYWMLWKWHKEAVGLRINYLASRPKGAETNTVLITDIPGIKDGTKVNRAMFLVPDKKKGAVSEKLVGTAAGAKSGGAGCLGKASNSVFTGMLSSCNKMHRGDKLPITTYTREGEPQYAAPITAPGTMDMVSSSQGSTAPADGRVVDNVAGIPIAAELRAWPKADRMLASGMAPAEMVDAEFREVFGDEYIRSQLAYNTSGVEGPHSEYEKRHESMLDTFDAWSLKAAKGKLVKKGKPVEQPKATVIPLTLGKWGTENYGTKKHVKAPVIDFNLARMDELERVIKQKQAEAKDKPASAAFATFKNRVKQTLVATSLVHHDTSSWQAKDAPAPQEVLWPNLRWRAWERSSRRVAMGALYIAMLLLFMIPVTAIQGMIGSVSWFDWVQDYPQLDALYTAVVPTVVLKIFIAILPTILRLMMYYSGTTSIAEVDLAVEAGYYGFTYVTIFLTSLLAGSLLESLQEIIDDPGSIITILGQSVPSQALFFTTYVMLEGLVTVPINLLTGSKLALYTLKCYLLGSERAKSRVWHNLFANPDEIGEMMLAFLLIMVFTPVFPIMGLFGVVYFVTGIICWKYKLVYMVRAQAESGGRLWPKAYKQILFNLFTMQLLMCFIVAIKKTIAPAIALAVPMVATPIFGHIANKAFKQPLKIMSLRAAASQDEHDALLAAGKDVEGESQEALNAYVQPVMRPFDEARHEAFKAEAAKWQALWASGTYNPADFAPPPSEDGSAAAKKVDEETAAVMMA